jgi:hypothetical protein
MKQSTVISTILLFCSSVLAIPMNLARSALCLTLVSNCESFLPVPSISRSNKAPAILNMAISEPNWLQSSFSPFVWEQRVPNNSIKLGKKDQPAVHLSKVYFLHESYLDLPITIDGRETTLAVCDAFLTLRSIISSNPLVMLSE